MTTVTSSTRGSVLVTGASTGIGRATARYLAERSTRIFAGVRREEDADSLRAEGLPEIVPIRLDVTRADEISAARAEIGRALAATGESGLAGIVNNAGLAVPAVQEFIDVDEFRRQIEVNLIGVVAVNRAFLPLVRAARGRIVNVGSLGGYNAAPFLGPYAASKFALEGLTDSLRRELRPWGLQVALVEPGSIATPIWEKSLGYGEVLKKKLPPEALPLYAKLLEKIEDYARAASRRGIPAERVARAIHVALTATRPRTRYRVGLDAHLIRLLTRLLPDRAMDAIVSRFVGIPGPGSGA
jgi:NAD(P)-dependent dehydrogenase (short-subunit alcohol dehydrogenase family)